MVLHNLQAAKDDDAVKKQRPAVIRRLRLLHHAEAGFLPAPHGVDLVPGHPAVEVELSVLRVIPMIDGKSIGVVSIAQNGENAPLLLFQDSDAFLWGERLFYPGHGTEGRRGSIQLFGQNGIKRQIAAGIAVVAAAVPDDALLLHAGLAHDLAGIGVVNIVSGRYFPEMNFPDQILDHSPQSFRSKTLTPPGFPDTIAQLRSLILFVDVDNGNTADGLAQFLRNNGPLIEIQICCSPGPCLGDLPGNGSVSMGLPGQIPCHLCVMGPVAEHGISVLGGEGAQQQAIRLQTAGSLVIHMLISFDDNYIINAGFRKQRKQGLHGK